MTDLISREAAIEAVEGCDLLEQGDYGDGFSAGLRAAIQALSSLPSVDEPPLRWERVAGRDIQSMRDAISPELRNSGDCILVWVNEGDINNRLFNRQ